MWVSSIDSIFSSVNPNKNNNNKDPNEKLGFRSVKQAVHIETGEASCQQFVRM